MKESSAKKFLRQKQQQRADVYLEYAETNLKQIQELLNTYRISDSEEIYQLIKDYLEKTSRSEATKLELPAMGPGLLSNIHQNCSLYLGNIHAANRNKEKDET